MPTESELEELVNDIFYEINYKNYDKVTDKRQVCLLDNFYLPVYYGSSVNREYVVTEKKYSQEEVKAIFAEKLKKIMADLEEEGVQIVRKNAVITKLSNRWHMNVELQIVEKTGERVSVAVQKEKPTEETQAQE